MRRRGFQEVALSLTEPGTILHDSSNRSNQQHHISATSFSPTPVETAVAAFTVRRKTAPALHSLRKSASQDLSQSHTHSYSQGHSARSHHLAKQLPRHSASSPQVTSAVLRQDRNLHTWRKLSHSLSVSTLNDSETDSADYESKPVEDKPGTVQATASTAAPPSSSVTRIVTSVRRKAKSVGRTVATISRSALSSGRSGSDSSGSTVQNPIEVRPKKPTVMENADHEKRIDGWQGALKAALKQDLHGQMEDALESYDRLNRHITKGAIYDYELLSCDQKKLLSQVLTCLDMRTQQLRIKLEGSRAQINKPGLSSTGPLSKDAITEAAETMALDELTKCLEVLDTIRRMGSKGKVPVVLVYRERKHRTHHRHEDKGQSNKVIFAKEKRDFLSLLGLPGSMISEKGLDFTVRPNTATALRKMQEEEKSNDADKTRSETTEVASELEPDEKNGGTAVQTDDDTDSPRTGKKNLLSYVPFIKKTSITPHPQSDQSEEECEGEEGEEDVTADVRSTLSCDSCSSAGSSDTEEEVEDRTDSPVPSAMYAHKDTILPPPFGEAGSQYVTLVMEKVGVKNTGRIICPFARISVRDDDGFMISPGSAQETAEWETINRNYFRAPSQIHIQTPLHEIPEDSSVFIELRSYRPQKNVISTFCYTFLERKHLSNGSYVCELYSPPVDFTRKTLKTYTEKALFLHLDITLRQVGSDSEEVEVPRSTTSS